jgi:lysozyme family protein
MTDDDILNAIIQREGGYVDHPADRGGPTKYGITIGTLQDWVRHPVTDDDVKVLTENDARAIYQERYIKAPGLDQIADGRLRALMVDSAVNHGPSASIKLLQRALGVAADGIWGAKTLEALLNADSKTVYLKACAQRVRFYGRIISGNPEQSVFAAGWMNRIAEFIES